MYAIYFVDTNKSPPNVYQSQKKYIRLILLSLIANYYNLKKIRINPLLSIFCLMNIIKFSKNKHFQKYNFNGMIFQKNCISENNWLSENTENYINKILAFHYNINDLHYMLNFYFLKFFKQLYLLSGPSTVSVSLISTLIFSFYNYLNVIKLNYLKLLNSRYYKYIGSVYCTFNSN
uniref:Cyclin_C domain-containing protein n=1 Tax=Heterorhabditis bacteriophora TaxID=37862 RepID=A0A1I7WI95_HETBA